jgi:hypothetical protein
MKRFIPIALILLILLISFDASQAQCAMCTGTVETAHGSGTSSVAEGINKGVLYIFMMPYLILGTIGYFWWRGRKKQPTE